jgi:hypothetical protein
MNPNVIIDLVQLVISLANTHRAGQDVAQILLDIVRKAVRAYEDQTGLPLNEALIRAENAI